MAISESRRKEIERAFLLELLMQEIIERGDWKPAEEDRLLVLNDLAEKNNIPVEEFQAVTKLLSNEARPLIEERKEAA